MRKSVVFIIDSQFDSVVYRDKALKYVKEYYRDMEDNDYFGLISLDSKHQDEILLSECHSNKKLKCQVIEDIKQREIEYNYHNYQDQGTQSQRVSSKLRD